MLFLKVVPDRSCKVAMSGNNASLVRVDFSICAETQYGDTICIAGNVVELGKDDFLHQVDFGKVVNCLR